MVLGWLVDFGFNGPLRQYFSLYRAVSQRLVGWLVWVERTFETVFQSISGRLPERGRKRRESIDESKNVQTTPTRTFCKRSRPLPYCNPNCRTPRYWKFTQHHRTTRPLLRWCWVKLPVPGRPTIWITVGQGPTALAVGAGGGYDIFTPNYPFFLLPPSLWETARYRLKYCLKGPLNPKLTNQLTKGR